MWDKIVDPRTGKKVNLNTKIGKHIINNYIRQSGGVNLSNIIKWCCSGRSGRSGRPRLSGKDCRPCTQSEISEEAKKVFSEEENRLNATGKAEDEEELQGNLNTEQSIYNELSYDNDQLMAEVQFMAEEQLMAAQIQSIMAEQEYYSNYLTQVALAAISTENADDVAEAIGTAHQIYVTTHSNDNKKGTWEWEKGFGKRRLAEKEAKQKILQARRAALEEARAVREEARAAREEARAARGAARGAARRANRGANRGATNQPYYSSSGYRLTPEELELYEILGVEPNDKLRKIKVKYHKLAMKYHPDKTKLEQSVAVEKFQQLTDAYNKIVALNRN
jgi:DnaJ-domain-containing protein 1